MELIFIMKTKDLGSFVKKILPFWVMEEFGNELYYEKTNSKIDLRKKVFQDEKGEVVTISDTPLIKKEDYDAACKRQNSFYPGEILEENITHEGELAKLFYKTHKVSWNTPYGGCIDIFPACGRIVYRGRRTALVGETGSECMFRFFGWIKEMEEKGLADVEVYHSSQPDWEWHETSRSRNPEWEPDDDRHSYEECDE